MSLYRDNLKAAVWRETDRQIETGTETESQREPETNTETETYRQTERERQRQKNTETATDSIIKLLHLKHRCTRFHLIVK